MSETIAGIRLSDGEEVLYDTRPSWLAWRKLFWGSVLLALPTFGLSLLLLTQVWWERRKTRYIVTTERVAKREGRRGVSTTEFRIDDIRQIETKSTWIAGKFGKGSITMTTHSGAELEFKGMPAYQEVANAIREHQRQEVAPAA